MKNLQQIKDEYARGNGYEDWEDLTSTYKYNIFKYQSHLNQIAILYAQEQNKELVPVLVYALNNIQCNSKKNIEVALKIEQLIESTTQI